VQCALLLRLNKVRRLIGLCELLLPAALVFSAGGLYAQADFQVNSTLVVLQVTVEDHHGKLVGDLPESAFHVYEDGVPQTLTLFRHADTPVAVGLVVDNSGSMSRKLPEVVAAADAFARSCNPGDQMFVLHFNENVSLGLPSGEAFTSSPEVLNAAMSKITARGKTALYDAVTTALDHIARSPLQKKVLIVISDGGDNASKLRFQDVLEKVQRSDVIVYTVGLFDVYDTDRNPGVLKDLAKASGGQAFFPKEIPDVTNILQEVSHDIRSQYTLGYVPSNSKRDGAYRQISVKLTGPHTNHLTARTRAGYIAQ